MFSHHLRNAISNPTTVGMVPLKPLLSSRKEVKFAFHIPLGTVPLKSLKDTSQLSVQGKRVDGQMTKRAQNRVSFLATNIPSQELLTTSRNELTKLGQPVYLIWYGAIQMILTHIKHSEILTSSNLCWNGTLNGICPYIPLF
jgi:hypothetical protein